MTRRWLLPLSAALLLTAGIAVYWLPRADREPDTSSDPEARLRAACTSCHSFPPPDILPRSAWRTQIEHMDGLIEYLPEEGASPFSVEEAVAWYEARAPEQLPVEPRLTREEAPPLVFRRRNAFLEPGGGPGIATVTRLEDFPVPGLDPALASAHMMNGSVHLFSLQNGPRRVGEAGHPARISTGDLDGDGLSDLVVSDLGSPMPTDDAVGRVLVGRNQGDGSFAWQVAVEGIGRVSDARPIDLDGDGDLDIAVAVFGWLRRGGAYVLHNETTRPGPLTFRAEKVSARPGAVSVVPVDDLGPGPGFAVAFSQHNELISVFHAAEAGFEERILYRAPHPNWGTSNLEAVDLDGDSDTDFLLSHGDTLDDGIAFKPYHGVEWLENRGGEFHTHHIGALYGAHAAAASDLDGDGDLDVVASGFLPQVQLPVPAGAAQQVDSVIWFERRGDEWIPWSVGVNLPRHTGMTVVDLNDDGRPDIVAGINTAWDVTARQDGIALAFWLNEGPR